MNCDSLAPIYRPLEYLAFRRKLEKQRFEFLNEVRHARRALLLGDGDGRFLLQLATRNIDVEIDCVEASGAMIHSARRRLCRAAIPNPGRIRFQQSDARLCRWPVEAYDLVVTHFFLDCFSAADLSRLIPAIRSACAPGASWLIAEFQEPENGWRKWHARAWLTTMYWFFRLTTGIETLRLPEYRKAISTAGFSLTNKKLAMAQLISSELWALPDVQSS